MNEQEVRNVLSSVLVNADVAGAILGIHEATVYRWITNGILDGIKVTQPGAKRTTYKVKSASIRKILGMEVEQKPVIEPSSDKLTEVL